MSPKAEIILTVALIVVSMLAGYVCRRRGWAPERLAEAFMTVVVVFGYSTVGFLAVWTLQPRADHVLLPILGTVQVIVMCGVGLVAGKLVTRDRGEQGVMTMACGSSNNGFTMGGFILYLLMGEEGLGLATMYGLMWTPVTVLVLYPIARHFASEGPREPLWRLMLRSLLDWRSVGLPITLAGIALGAWGVPRPRFIDDWHVVDAMMFLVIVMGYFAIGLRLRLGRTWALRKLLATLAVVRFGGGLAVGVALAAATTLTPWAFGEAAGKVFVIQAFMPTAVTMVAVANMFRVRPREASVLFVVNTLTYLAVVLPLVLWFFGG